MMFRKLRLNWRYALGEIFIVTIGVFIALAADNWRKAREDRSTELAYVERLIADLNVDIAALSNGMELSQRRVEYAETIVEVYDTGRRSGSTSDFVEAIEYGNYFAYPNYAKATIEDLMSTGNLRLLRSAEVKEAMNRYYGTIEWIEQFTDINRETQIDLSKLIPEFLEIETRNALFNQGFSPSCGPTLACEEGIPWAPSTLNVSDEDAERVLERLLSRPEGRTLYAGMIRIQGAHYANLASIRAMAMDTLTVLEGYSEQIR